MSDDFLIALFITAGINIIATVFLLKGLSYLDLSIATPILALTPVFALLSSYILLKEAPSLMGVLGIGVSAAGLALINYKARNKNSDAKKEKIGLLLIFLVTFLYSISANFDKLAAIKSSPLFGTLVVTCLIGAGMLAMVFLKKEQKILVEKNNFLKIILLGMIVLVSIFVWYLALSKGMVAYSLAIRRTAAVIGIIYGYFWFKEKNIRERFLGAAIILIGLFLIIFFK